MDAKIGAYYPVFMINESYGGRGLNFRAQNNAEGITMLILGSFLDRRTKNQVLQRVGRFTDKCTRIRDTHFDEFDDEKNAKRLGMISKFLEKLQQLKMRQGVQGQNIIVQSKTEFKDNHLSNREYLNKEQQERLSRNKRPVRP